MPGLLLQDSGFSLENDTTFSLSNAFCSQDSSACSALQQDKICTAASSRFSSDSPLTNSGISRCLDASCCISRTLPNFKHRCSSSLMRAATTHASSTRSWSPPSIDVNNGDDEVAGLQDYETVWSDVVENGTDGSSLSGCNTGIMLGSFFCDMTKDVAKGAASFPAEGSPSGSPTSPTVASPLSKYFTSLTNDDCWTADYVYASDEFRMFEFKVRRCTRGRSHDWTECPFAHPGEKARRRDPRRFHYSGTACPDFRKGNCKRGDACEFAHGVFECWLHPARYRTQPCKDGRSCTRRVCFFAHTPEQLRLLPAASSALRINGSCDLQTNSPLYQNAFFSGNCFNEDIFDENATTFGMLGCTGSFDGSRCLHVGSPRVSHNRCTTSLTASPTSTLACMPRSPPSISPPLSPSPSSPASPLTWHGRPLSPALPIAATARSFPLLSPSRSNFPRVQALLAAAQADASSFNSVQHNSVPLSFPGYAHTNLYKPFSSAPASPSAMPPSPSRKTMNDLVTAVQQLDLKNANQIWLQHSASPHASAPSPLSRTSNTVGSSASDNLWYSDVIDEDDYKLQRVESGKALRAKFYGRVAESGKQMDQDESPDLGWVNDLVLE